MFDFGTRKLVSINYTRYIALPKTWVNGVGLGGGGHVKIAMDADNRLIISAEATQ